MRSIAWILIVVTTLLVACTNEGYETGDGKFSRLTTEFVEVYSNSQSMLTRAVDDNDNVLLFREPCSYSWVATPDSSYRAILYYNKAENEQTIQPYSLSPVLVLMPKSTADVNDIHTDPIVFESAWIGKNRKYMNLGIAVKVGTADSQTENLKQTVGILCDEITTRGDGTKCYHFRVYHNQNGVPEYYTSRMFVSIPLEGVGANDEIELTINTYQGVIIVTR